MVDLSSWRKSVTSCVKESQKIVSPLLEKANEKVCTPLLDKANEKICSPLNEKFGELIYSLDKDSLDDGWTERIIFASNRLIELGIGTYLPLLSSFFTPIIAEIVAGKVPNQRLDRVVRYTQGLEARLAKLETEKLSPLLSDANFRNLVKESCFQAMQSVSEKRFDYLSSVVMNGILKDNGDFVLPQNILNVLKSVNDLEIQLLKHYKTLSSEKISGIDLNNSNVNSSTLLSPEDEELNDKYKEHLWRLKLLKKDVNDINEHSLGFKHSSHHSTDEYDLSKFGEVFLKYIGN
jgi:hypothetical protein